MDPDTVLDGIAASTEKLFANKIEQESSKAKQNRIININGPPFYKNRIHGFQIRIDHVIIDDQTKIPFMAFINRVVTRIICDIIKSGPQEPEPGNLQIRPVYQAVYVLGLAEQYIVGPGRNRAAMPRI